MIVYIEEAIFSSIRTDHMKLLRILDHGFEGRHRVLTEPPYDPQRSLVVNEWISKQSEDVQETVKLALESGIRLDGTELPADRSLIVADITNPDYSSDPPRLLLEPACKLLDSPLQLLLENWKNDWAFVKTVATSKWNKALREVKTRAGSRSRMVAVSVTCVRG
jgi:hypothetical protein